MIIKWIEIAKILTVKIKNNVITNVYYSQAESIIAVNLTFTCSAE